MSWNEFSFWKPIIHQADDATAINTEKPGDVVLGGNTATTDMAGVVFAVPEVFFLLFSLTKLFNFSGWEMCCY